MSFERRVEHYEEAVVENIDRPKWHEKKARSMLDRWKDNIRPYHEVESQIKVILNKRGVPTPCAAPYHSFAKKIYKLVFRKNAPFNQVKDELDRWTRYKCLDATTLKEIFNFITGQAKTVRK